MQDDRKITLAEYRKLIQGKKCVWCGTTLPKEIEIKNYQHPNGWLVRGFRHRQWLYVKCPSCGYECSLGKLGVERDYGAFYETDFWNRPLIIFEEIEEKYGR
jgi:hypothetical protein